MAGTSCGTVSQSCIISVWHKFDKHYKSSLNILPHYFVYGWKRNESYLYIGVSHKGYGGRLKNHNVIGIVERFSELDTIDIWLAINSRFMYNLESALIDIHQPPYNIYKTEFNKRNKLFIPTTAMIKSAQVRENNNKMRDKLKSDRGII